MAVSRKVNGEFVDLFRKGPFDPCVEDLELAESKSQYREHMAKHGNMSVHHVCPFKKV